MKTFTSDLSHTEFPMADRVSGSSVRHSIMTLIRKDHPGFTSDMQLAVSELNAYKEKYIRDYLERQTGDLTSMEQTVLDSMTDQATLTDKIDTEGEQRLTSGQRIADKVASFGGSWTFIIIFGAFLLLWISANVFWLANKAWDPYPFILLNLILSCIAAIQAPVIMMSQNRQEDKDRERARSDYMVNLKSELEIRMLHEKLDHLIIHQQQELLEIQKVQVEMLTDIFNRIDTK